jgi:hypothetical protein
MPRRQHTPYDEDDLDISQSSYRPATQAGLISLVSMLISVALLGMIGILGIMIHAGPSQDETALLLVAVLFLDVAALVASVVGLYQGFRAQGREQVLNRGYGLAGLIGSILCMLIAVAIGVVSTCAGLFVAAVHNVPGG